MFWPLAHQGRACTEMLPVELSVDKCTISHKMHYLLM